MIARLQRVDTGDYGTLGALIMPMLVIATIEPPWRNNERDISCIPEGMYHCIPYEHYSRGLVYVLMDVPDRSEIMIHIGNHAGDKSKGYHTDSMGCILPGLYHHQVMGQTGVVESKQAMQRMRDVIGHHEFSLIIENIIDVTKGGKYV